MSSVRTGGQRVRKVERVYWSVFYTRYFYRKFYARYAARFGLRAPMGVALAAFACFSAYRELLRPALYRAFVAASRRRRRALA